MRRSAADFFTPDWVKHAVFYQIFPDRFANGDPSNDPANVQPWGAPPTPYNFMGGDLRGILQKLDYLQDLGITAIYLNPIFQSTSNHRYNTYDYYRIDPKLGTMEDFQTLLREMHRRGMRVILDGVFNHCGRGFYPFHDVVENGEYSPYVGWFHIKKFPIHPYDGRKRANYESWWGIRSLPKFNTDNPQVRQFLLDVARYWIEQGADGWRLDVPNEIDDDTFWREFRQVVKSANPDAYIVGEIWKDAKRWLQGDQFDAVMNYPLRDLCVEFVAKRTIRAPEFANKLLRLFRRYPAESTYAQLNLLGSHDTPRWLTVCGEDVRRAMLGYTLLFTLPGAPCIYYGDEIGMTGEADPHCRACFAWDRRRWNRRLHQHIRQMIALRQSSTAWRTGQINVLLAQGDALAYARWDDADTFIVLVNNGNRAWRDFLPLRKSKLSHIALLQDVRNKAAYPVENKRVQLTVPASSWVILRAVRE
ncbi:MAG: glycoside hydrolase family 13 protein [Armatimonadota bacterium]|nr:glycoside hydrolase family 13 protein [bacterium]MDW8320506.1 glycoside hydrolase family 13 protein [Armatimonadota bacterium]